MELFGGAAGWKAGVLEKADPATAVVDSLGLLHLRLGEIEVSENMFNCWFVCI